MRASQSYVAGAEHAQLPVLLRVPAGLAAPAAGPRGIGADPELHAGPLGAPHLAPHRGAPPQALSVLLPAALQLVRLRQNHVVVTLFF